ncbi:MAG: GTP 3',8-cyclase MoaA [Candidatus Eisenbacteria bacterium]
MRDPWGREITCLRLSITERCNLRCVYCQPAVGIRLVPKSEVLTYGEIIRVVRCLVESAGLARVRITGGEPLVRPSLLSLIERLARLDLEELTLTTNGQLLAPLAKALKEAGIRRVNISIDTLRPDLFENLTRGGDLGRTLEGIEAALAAGLTPVRLNVVLMKGWNDEEVVEFVRYALDRGLEVRFLELMPIGRPGLLHSERFVSMASAVERLREGFQLTELSRFPGTTSIPYRVSDGNGRTGGIGFIAPVTRPFCNECGRLRLSATGILRGCLMHREGSDLKSVLRDSTRGGGEAGLLRGVREAIGRKPWAGHMESTEGMYRLGG